MSSADFDRMYRDEPDPWRVATSWYEQRKLAVVLASLAERTYQHGLDPACGTGHLARELAKRCDRVVAADASAVAIEMVRHLCADAPNVTAVVRALPYGPIRNDAHVDPYDLIVLSEVLYYLPEQARREAVGSVVARAAHRVEVLAVHWLEQPEEALVSGEHVHAELRKMFQVFGFRHQVAHFDEEFVLDAFTRGHDQYPA